MLDPRFAAPDGIARDDFSDSGTDIPSAVAVHGDRIYTVGDVGATSTAGDVAIFARRTDGLFDGGFSGDGKLVLPIAAGTGKDVAVDIAVLPDGRLRVLASADADAGSATDIDVAVLGLNADGSPDTSFSDDGRVDFPATPSARRDTPTRMAIGPTGRIAITGAAADANGKEDTFVALLEPGGAPVAGFGNANGVRVLDRAGGGRNDRGMDVEFRPGGGILSLIRFETSANNAVNGAVHAFDDAAADDPRFAGGDLELTVGVPDTVPGSLLSHRGRIWLSGETHVGTDTDAFIARVNADGSGFESRLFDMRGTAIPSDALVASSGSDLALVPGEPPTLVVTGSINYSSRPFWAAAAFNNIDGPLAQAGFGDLLMPTDEYGLVVGVAAGPEGWAAIAGSLVDTSNNFDTYFGTARLLLDGDKKCDLALEVVEPLEVAMPVSGRAPITFRVTNDGTRACSGTLSAPAPYLLDGAPLTVGPVGPRSSVTTTGIRMGYGGELRRDDVILLRVSGAGDTNPDNDVRALRVVFNFCDLALRTVGRAPAAPVEGPRRYELSVRNQGTTPCERVRVGVSAGGRTAGSPDRFALRPGRSASVDVRAIVARGGRPGDKARLTFRALAREDAVPGNDRATLSPRLVGVGDSRIARASARGFGGTARGAGGSGDRALLRLRGVEVAVKRLGGERCRVLTSRSGRLREVRAGAGGKCSRRVWVRARGKRSWRLGLRRALPAGRYVVFSRAVTGPRFHEAAFSERDRNRVTFEVG